MARKVNLKRREEKLDRILEAARAVFCRKGFSDVHMKDIIEECGISRGGIYLYFSSVDEIFQTVIAQRNRNRSYSIRRAIEENADFFQLMDEYFAAQKQRLLHIEHSLLRATYEYRFTHKGQEDQAFQSEQMHHIQHTILEILQLGVGQKAIPPHNIQALSENLMYVIEGLSMLALIGELEEARIDTQFQLVRDLLLQQSALGRPPSNRILRVLVTAGETSEQIDALRCIVNPATGKLGSLTADMFALMGAKVTYVGGMDAIPPAQSMEAVYTVRDVHALKTLLTEQLKSESFDCIFHSMSVSEYTLRQVTTTTHLAQDISARLQTPASQPIAEVVQKAIGNGKSHTYASKRMPPNVPGMVLIMDPAPPILSILRKMHPNAILIGCKLLVDVSAERLVAAANEWITQEGCDFVLSNDIQGISEKKHQAILVGKQGDVQALHTKQEIAQTIVRRVLDHDFPIA